MRNMAERGPWGGTKRKACSEERILRRRVRLGQVEGAAPVCADRRGGASRGLTEKARPGQGIKQTVLKNPIRAKTIVETMQRACERATSVHREGEGGTRGRTAQRWST